MCNCQNLKAQDIKMKWVVILIPGLGDDASKLQLVTRHWPQKYNIETILYLMPWMGNSESFEQKLNRLIKKIDTLHENGYTISLLGTSAGGSCAINAYCKRREKIAKVINVCGRLRKGKNVFPSLDIAAKNSPSFKESVLLCEENLKSLNDQDRKKILTIRSYFDEIVPVSFIPIDGAHNIRIFSVEHILSISLAMTLYSKNIIDFILQNP